MSCDPWASKSSESRVGQAEVEGNGNPLTVSSLATIHTSLTQKCAKWGLDTDWVSRSLSTTTAALIHSMLKAYTTDPMCYLSSGRRESGVGVPPRDSDQGARLRVRHRCLWRSRQPPLHQRRPRHRHLGRAQSRPRRRQVAVSTLLHVSHNIVFVKEIICFIQIWSSLKIHCLLKIRQLLLEYKIARVQRFGVLTDTAVVRWSN